jgi:hypothetical protein
VFGGVLALVVLEVAAAGVPGAAEVGVMDATDWNAGGGAVLSPGAAAADVAARGDAALTDDVEEEVRGTAAVVGVAVAEDVAAAVLAAVGVEGSDWLLWDKDMPATALVTEPEPRSPRLRDCRLPRLGPATKRRHIHYNMRSATAGSYSTGQNTSSHRSVRDYHWKTWFSHQDDLFWYPIQGSQ